MAQNQFGACLYRCQRDMLDEIAYEWLTGNAVFGDFERDVLAHLTDEELAGDCIKEWQLDQPLDVWPQEGPELSHMDAEGYDETDLRRAFARLRERAESLPNGEV